MARLIFLKGDRDASISENERYRDGDLIAVREDNDPYTKSELNGQTFTRKAAGPASGYHRYIGPSVQGAGEDRVQLVAARFKFSRVLSRLEDKEGREIPPFVLTQDPDPRTR